MYPVPSAACQDVEFLTEQRHPCARPAVKDRHLLHRSITALSVPE